MCRKDWGRKSNCRDRLVVRTLRCGRSNPGSNPGHGIFSPKEIMFVFLFFFVPRQKKMFVKIFKANIGDSITQNMP